VRLTAALLLSAGAHLTALSVAGTVDRPAPASAEAPSPPPLRAALAVHSEEPAPAEPQRSLPKAAPAAAPAPTPYLRTAELDVRPQIKTHVMPEYPKDVLPGTRGRVVLELRIGVDGRVASIDVARAEPGGVFEEAAVQAFFGARFSPGMKSGVAVPTLMRVEVSFGD
jgi:protein TonB